ncbi:hypothetical protein C8A01DRAFT_33914 [Parachaetomium inaequale]|uniref:Uncharacterized protein n=1 Tax=Parachaetomium inaequale TaxID=2588326 RepID=A0AAN6PLC7_9PEZI|nr:hypothetical protein C8A01DRAFT_33914 [Parachaetomium inaequale]
MPRNKQPDPTSKHKQREDAVGDGTGPLALRWNIKPLTPSKDCRAACCLRGEDWIYRQLALDEYINGPTPDARTGVGGWKRLSVEIGTAAYSVRELGLARWRNLSLETREKLEKWSPVDDLVKCRSSWTHVRALRGDLDVVRAREDAAGNHGSVFLIQFHAWVRITEHLVRQGLGLDEFASPYTMMAHFKQSLRHLLTNGTQLPDQTADARWEDWGYTLNATDQRSRGLKRLLRDVLSVQYFIHGLEGSHAVRFTPLGTDKLWGFPFDKDWMRLQNAVEVPPSRPGDEALPPVQLVSDPMLVVSGRHDLGYDQHFGLLAPTTVVTPWTFGGEEAREHVWPQRRQEWEARRVRKLWREAWVEEQAGGRAQGQDQKVEKVKSGRGATKKTKEARGALEASKTKTERAREEQQHQEAGGVRRSKRIMKLQEQSAAAQSTKGK